MIARAMVHEPRMLILDEPTAGVDIEIRRSMWNFLREINSRGTTIILTTHYLEEAENLCRNIAIINHGVIIENTSMRALLNKLHIQTFVLDLANAIEQIPEVNGLLLKKIDDCTLEVEVDKSIELNEVFARLSQAGISVSSLRNKSGRLEELFLRLVEDSRAEARKSA
jgi:ABC-2 type transport system ATP-binding protein